MSSWGDQYPHPMHPCSDLPSPSVIGHTSSLQPPGVVQFDIRKTVLTAGAVETFALGEPPATTHAPAPDCLQGL